MPAEFVWIFEKLLPDGIFIPLLGLEFSQKEKISNEQQLCERKCLEIPQEDTEAIQPPFVPIWTDQNWK